MTADEARPQPERPRILIVDDAVTIRRYHRMLVEAIGCDVEEAENGIEALERALQSRFDLFLVDVNMPRMDGYRFVEEVRKAPELRAVPAIMISTESEAADRDKAWRAGANGYLIKPVKPDELQAHVRLMTQGCAP
jgi:two-component system chemotaxis response regulator CheY